MGKPSQTLHQIRQKGEQLKKTERIEIRLTPEQKTKIVNNSIKAKTTISDFVIKSAINQEIVIYDDLGKLVTQLRKLGNNVNQLTKKAHQGQINCVDLEGTKKELNQIWQSLNLLITKTV